MSVTLNLKNSGHVAFAPTPAESQARIRQLERTAKRLGIDVDIIQESEDRKPVIQVIKKAKIQGITGIFRPKVVQTEGEKVSLDTLSNLKNLRQTIATIAAVASEKLFRATRSL